MMREEKHGSFSDVEETLKFSKTDERDVTWNRGIKESKNSGKHNDVTPILRISKRIKANVKE